MVLSFLKLKSSMLGFFCSLSLKIGDTNIYKASDILYGDFIFRISNC